MGFLKSFLWLVFFFVYVLLLLDPKLVTRNKLLKTEISSKLRRTFVHIYQIKFMKIVIFLNTKLHIFLLI